MSSVVEVQLYSGGRNPRFVLSRDDAAEMRRVFAIEFARNAPADPGAPRLGYQGFIVYENDLTGATVPMGSWQPRLRVMDGVATLLYGPYAGQSRRAPALERHLIATARRADLGPLLDSAHLNHGEDEE